VNELLEKVDLSLKISTEEYLKELPKVQLKLVRLQQRMRVAGVPVVIMYEGRDASGKGGSILRITEKIDPRGCHVWPIGPPDEAEKAHNYLWRFWTRLPERGEIAIFDRSWYGRVLVERVEHFCKPCDWKRAYEEIRNFERSLTDDGTILIKFWMQISKEEQLKRFKARETDPFKEWKITPDDWENRDRWDDYTKAAEDMFAETNTKYAPWHIVSAECKPYARIQTVRTVVKALEDALGPDDIAPEKLKKAKKSAKG